MFSRRHPFLYFMLLFTTICFTGVILIALIILIGSKTRELDFGEKVGVIEVKGPIVESRDTIEQLKKFREDESIKAIVMRVDSPGGGVGPSQEIYREIRKTIKTKKIFTSMGSVAASGGYYIAAATDGIMANPGTITGSIGVIVGYTNFQEIFKKIGLVPIVFKSGKFKDMGSPVRDLTPEEKEMFQQFVDKIHQQFVQDVANGRQMELATVQKIANGQIYTGKEAKALGLVDRLGNLEDTVEWAGRSAGIEGEIGTVYGKSKPFSIMEFLRNAFQGSSWFSSSVWAQFRYPISGQEAAR